MVWYIRGAEEEGGDEYNDRFNGGTGREGHKGVTEHFSKPEWYR